MAFHHFERCHEVAQKFHALEKRIAAHPLAEDIWNVYDWLLAPYTLWPVDFAGLAIHIVDLLKVRRDFDSDLILLLNILDSPPKESTQAAIGAYEQTVAQGKYDSLVKQPQKFMEHEAQLQQDAELAGLWRKICQRFSTGNFEVNAKRIIRRSMSQERNFRPNLRFAWKKRKEKFDMIFDALCHRWILYGFEGDKPLLLKISANPTPHGTMIVIPRHWSFDRARDLDWAAISRLHRAHGPLRGGPKLSNNRILHRQDVVLAKRLDAECKRRGLKGSARYAYICRGMKKDENSDASWLKRLLKG